MPGKIVREPCSLDPLGSLIILLQIHDHIKTHKILNFQKLTENPKFPTLTQQALTGPIALFFRLTSQRQFAIILTVL